MPRQVFISHASADRAAAEKFCAAIEGAGLPCWLAFRDIPLGTSYSGAILAAIESSSVVLVLLSTQTSHSPHVLRELDIAVGRRLPIVPVRIEDVRPSRDLEYFLSAVQWIDAFPEIRPDVIRRVVDGLRALAGHVPEPAYVAPAPPVPAPPEAPRRAPPRAMAQPLESKARTPAARMPAREISPEPARYNPLPGLPPYVTAAIIFAIALLGAGFALFY